MAKGKFEFEHPGMPVGDHFIRVRNQDMPAPSTERIALALHQDILQHEPICKEDDWLVVAQVPNLETLDPLVANFPSNFRWFNVPDPELVRDGMPAAFVWISELRGQPSHHDAYTHAERLMIVVQPLLKTLMHNFGGIRLTKEVAKLSISPPQAYSMVNLTGYYSAQTLVRVLPPEAMMAMSAAPKITDYTSPTWGEYLQTKMAQDDQTFRKIIRHLSTGDYKDLYIVYEAILSRFNKDKVKAAEDIARRGWATDAELVSFQKTANNRFRHFELRPQTVPFMEPCVADDLIRRLFSYFIVHCMRRDGLIPAKPTTAGATST